MTRQTGGSVVESRLSQAAVELIEASAESFAAPPPDDLRDELLAAVIRIAASVTLGLEDPADAGAIGHFADARRQLAHFAARLHIACDRGIIGPAESQRLRGLVREVVDEVDIAAWEAKRREIRRNAAG